MLPFSNLSPDGGAQLRAVLRLHVGGLLCLDRGRGTVWHLLWGSWEPNVTPSGPDFVAR